MIFFSVHGVDGARGGGPVARGTLLSTAQLSPLPVWMDLLVNVIVNRLRIHQNNLKRQIYLPS
jgi:hypothetical protein